MLYLFDANSRLIRKGPAVKANPDNMEFIINTDDCPLRIAELEEIARANKIKIKKNHNRASKFLAELVEGLEEMPTPEQNKPTQTEIATEVVRRLHEAGKEEEQMILELVNKHKFKLKQAMRAVANAMVEIGLTITNKERKEKIRQMLISAEFNPTTWADVEAMAEQIVKNVTDTSTAQALRGIRTYCAEPDIAIELPEAPRAQRGSFRTRMQNFILENIDATDAQVREFVVANTKKGAEKKDIDAKTNRVLEYVKFARRVAEAVRGAADTEETAEA